ncbi:MAG: response regulator transcription factor [Leptospirillia bacterium]
MYPAPENNPATILIVEDENDILELTRFNLQKNGYNTLSACTGDEGLRMVKAHRPDLVLLDLMLPNMDGAEVCLRIKSDPEFQGIPVMMVTAKSAESDVVRGLAIGADDYLAKPFSTPILVARVAALLRRTGSATQDEETPLSIKGLTIHTGRHEVTLNGTPLDLTLTEFSILNLLASRPGWVFPRRQIVAAIQGRADMVSERSVDVQVVALRRKLGGSGQLIETVRGVGYRFQG